MTYLVKERTTEQNFDAMTLNAARITEQVQEKRVAIQKENFGTSIAYCKIATISLVALTILLKVAGFALLSGVIGISAIIPLGIWYAFTQKEKNLQNALEFEFKAVADIYNGIAAYLIAKRKEKENRMISEFNRREIKATAYSDVTITDECLVALAQIGGFADNDEYLRKVRVLPDFKPDEDFPEKYQDSVNKLRRAAKCFLFGCNPNYISKQSNSFYVEVETYIKEGVHLYRAKAYIPSDEV